MAQASSTWTAEQVRALPDDGKRHEVVDGELLVTPSPATPHQRMVGKIHLCLAEYLRPGSVGEIFLSPADVEFDPHTLVQPDLFVVPLIEGKRLRNWSEIRDLLLAVEVLSPSSARYDRLIKRRRYQRAGVPEYWIVDLDARVVERWRPEDERPEVLSETLEWRPDPEQEPLMIDLVALFSEAWGE